jgi:hypothetical protein
VRRFNRTKELFLVMLSPAIHNAAENNLNELYIVAKTKVLLPV